MAAPKGTSPPPEIPLPMTPWWKETYEVKVWQWIGVLTSLVLIFFTTVIGMTVYLGDRDEAYRADQERECHVSVDGRSDLRAVILGIYDAIEADGQVEVVQVLRASLEATHPPFTFEECMEMRFGVRT